MKVYISLLITGHDIEQAEARCIFAKAVMEKKGYTIHNIAKYIFNKKKRKKDLFYRGKCVNLPRKY